MPPVGHEASNRVPLQTQNVVVKENSYSLTDDNKKAQKKEFFEPLLNTA